MASTPLALSLCLSILTHGTVFFAFYIMKYASADFKPSSLIADLKAIEIVIEPTPVLFPEPHISQPPPSNPIMEPAPTKPVAVLTAKSQVEATETISSVQQDVPATTELRQPATSVYAAQNVSMEIASPGLVSSPASCLTNPNPEYPKKARKRKEQGLVVVGVAVDEKGFPVDVWVIQSSGHGLLDAAAQAGIKQWRFIPAHVGSKPVKSKVEVPVRFRLSD